MELLISVIDFLVIVVVVARVGQSHLLPIRPGTRLDLFYIVSDDGIVVAEGAQSV